MGDDSLYSTEDRIFLSRRNNRRAALASPSRMSWLWTVGGGLVGSIVLLWVMVQMGQASPNAKGRPALPQQDSLTQPSGTQQAALGDDRRSAAEQNGESSTPADKEIQGPALEVPREVLAMLDQRKRSLDRREEAVRQSEERLLALRAEVDKLLAQNEAMAKRIETAVAKEEQRAAGQKTAQAKALLEKERLALEQKAQLAKMYETMPPEDAAARLERMPERTAIQILRLVKTKTAGAILAQVKPERAAKLTEQLLAQTP
ncbi:MotE family protein [Candidatus Nitrospira inopinata]|uniref:Magnesium transporter MgtE intracellular domain-containing protein n=1 Tax=Candidatus Nitrospira inopinata TaxID=1715989 RepID=A0A0S4KUX7_9BACT|nr:hypothetical protein [Candidatus Nitrospira inopinata]CUQ67104.1 protein of unknown function [Candidatus Nitrospira inopinata]